MKLRFARPLFILSFAIILLGSCNKNSLTPQSQLPLFTLASGQHYYGCIPSPPEALAAMPQFMSLSSIAPLPTSIMLNHPPIGDQGSQGSCVGWAAVTTRSVAYNNTANQLAWNTGSDIFSAAYVYDQIKVGDCGSGSYETSALSLLKSQGVCVYNLMPYTDQSCSAMPDASQKSNAANYKIQTAYNIPSYDINAIKYALSLKKPVMIAIMVDNLFESGGNANHIWTPNTGSSIGGHAITIIGYDDSKQAFYVQNQWGANWGDHGFIWIAYNMFNLTNKVVEAHTID